VRKLHVCVFGVLRFDLQIQLFGIATVSVTEPPAVRFRAVTVYRCQHERGRDGGQVRLGDDQVENVEKAIGVRVDRRDAVARVLGDGGRGGEGGADRSRQRRASAASRGAFAWVSLRR